MESTRFAGYRIVDFTQDTVDTLAEIAVRLAPHETDILNNWIHLQWDTWQPPGLTREDLQDVFGGLLRGLLRRLRERDLSTCILEFQEAGAQLAGRQFPFEALIISIHFLEESYMPHLLDQPPDKTQQWFVAMDEFLHAALAAVATSYFDAYREELLDRAEVGRIVQEGLLADIPKRAADLEISYVYRSARERARLGGDFLDVLEVGADIGFIIGDLSGHGLEAASESVMVRSLFKGFLCENPSLTDAMARLNRVLVSELRSGDFATALALSYDGSGNVGLVTAGHPFPIVCGQTGCTVIELSGTALAVDPESTYTLEQVSLEPGGILVACTDGLIEARNKGVLFGENAVFQAIEQVHNAPARAVAEHVVDQSLRHAGGKFSDDVAVLVLKRLPA